jgi:hypothetical protein
MEQMEKAMLRDERRLSQDILKPIEIRSISDIKRVLSELDPTRNQSHSEIPISTLMNEVEGGKNVTYNY